MPRRTLGLETEYAIRFRPAPRGPRLAAGRHPGNAEVFRALAAAVDELVLTAPGARRLLSEQRFTESGGAIYYEFLPQAAEGGLLEGATPECGGPRELLVYQRALDRLLERAIPGAERRLARRGFPGEVGLLKNCRDALDHVYGAQENYEVDVARGLALALWRAGLAVCVPIVLALTVLAWVLFLASVPFVLAAGFLLRLRALPHPDGAGGPPSVAEAERVAEREVDARLGKACLWLEYALWWPLLVAFGALLRATAFRRLRRDLALFLVTRAVVTGAGSVDAPDPAGGRIPFALSEKGPLVRAVSRSFVRPVERAIFDGANLLKDLVGPAHLRLGALLGLFRRRQRLQLGLSDSNAAQTAELLKIGTTLLAVEMAEAGLLADLPRPRDPVGALHAVVRDPSLTARVALSDGSERTALELQRLYCARARAYVGDEVLAHPESLAVVRRWEEVLDALERGAAGEDELFGRLDWVTKRALVSAAGPDAPAAVRRKLDLGYHELGRGYLARLERAGLAPRLVADEEVEAALHRPPTPERARARARWIRELALAPLPATVAWDRIRVGGPLLGRSYKL